MRLIDEQNQVIGEVKTKLADNTAVLEQLFADCGDMVKQQFLIASAISAYVIYVDGLTDHALVEDFVLRPLKNENLFEQIKAQQGRERIQWIKHTFARIANEQKKEQIQEMMELADVTWCATMDDAVVEILSGNTLLFVDGIAEAVVISSKHFPVRGVGEVDSEKTIRGAKDAFNENMRTGTALLRRRIRDPRLKVVQKKVGQRSRTNVAICYVEGIVRSQWLKQLDRLWEQVELDAIYDSGMLEQMLEPQSPSLFPRYQHTERPDKAASALLEGRIVLVVDNSPDVLILPATLNTFFQASDDYYMRHEIAVFARILRYLAAVLAIGLPGLYLAVTQFHTEILPMQLILTIAKAREHVPFPATVEVLLMELEFELLREAGIRLPGQMGNTIGVVGGLIVGQAAVEAGLVSTIVVIMVALTAIASFSIPNESFTSAFRLLKFMVIFACAFWGIYGFFLAMLLVFIHLTSLESFGLPYMMPAVSSGAADYDDTKDFILKKSLFTMKKRPVFAQKAEQVRMKIKNRRKES